MVPRKTWSRRLAMAGGAAAAAGGYWALRLPGGSAHHAIADARTLRRGNAAEPQTLDPSLSTGIQVDAIMGDLMVGLLAQDSLCRAIPGVATRWTTSPDGL